MQISLCSIKKVMDTQQTILLCEDEEFVARSYIRKLTLEGFSVVHAHNGADGLKQIYELKPDLVILDLLMPVKTGFEVLAELQNSEESIRNIPVIVASNLGQRVDIEEAQKLGAKDFLIKSNISLKELVEKVRRHLPTA